VAPELSAVVVYCQAVPFPGLAHALRHPQPCEMSSFSERKARKLIKEAGEGDGMGTGTGAGWLHAPDLTGKQHGAETEGLCHRGGSAGDARGHTGPGQAALVWWDWGLGPEAKVRVTGPGSGFGMWHLGPGSGVGSGAGMKI